MTKCIVENFINKQNDDNSAVEIMGIIKESPILSKEYIVYKNIENKSITNDYLASNYIGSNISLFDGVKYSDFLNEHAKLDKYNIDIVVDENKLKLYESIHNLITETTTKKGIKAVDKIYESFEYVLNFLKTNEIISESIEDQSENEIDGFEELYLINLVEKYNLKYETLGTKENNILHSLVIESTSENKKTLFESLKSETINKVIGLKNNTTSDSEVIKINETVSKLEGYIYEDETYLENSIKILDLYTGF